MINTKFAENIKSMTETLEKLRAMAEATSLTPEQKKELKAIIRDNSLSVEIKKTSCHNCWQDAAVAAYAELSALVTPSEGSGVRIRAGVDVIFGGERVNQATATPEKLARWIEAGLLECYWEKC